MQPGGEDDAVGVAREEQGMPGSRIHAMRRLRVERETPKVRKIEEDDRRSRSRRRNDPRVGGSWQQDATLRSRGN
jgi:hypothetical protein